MIRLSEKAKKSGDIISVPVNDIRPNPSAARTSFDWNELDGLAQSIYHNGLLQPLTIREVKNGKYQLVAGERRLRAARMAGLAEVPCVVVKISEEKSALMTITENIQRKELHFFEEAEAVRNIIKKYGMTIAQISKKLGIPQSEISDKLLLLRLPKKIREYIIRYGLTQRHASAIIRLNDYNLMTEALNAVIKNCMNVSDTEKLVDRLLNQGRMSESQTKTGGRKNVKIFKDVRIFINTLDHAVITMKKSGIKAEAFQREADGYIEYTVRINKSDVSRETLTK